MALMSVSGCPNPPAFVIAGVWSSLSTGTPGSTSSSISMFLIASLSVTARAVAPPVSISPDVLCLRRFSVISASAAVTRFSSSSGVKLIRCALVFVCSMISVEGVDVMTTSCPVFKAVSAACMASYWGVLFSAFVVSRGIMVAPRRVSSCVVWFLVWIRMLPMMVMTGGGFRRVWHSASASPADPASILVWCLVVSIRSFSVVVSIMLIPGLMFSGFFVM